MRDSHVLVQKYGQALIIFVCYGILDAKLKCKIITFLPFVFRLTSLLI